MRKVSVLGDGGWGTALALVLLSNGHDVTLWGRDPEKMETMRRTRENKYLKGITLPGNLKLESDPEAAVSGTELAVLATPSQFMRGTLQNFSKLLEPEKYPVVNVAKGIENSSLKRMSEVFEEFFASTENYVVLSGPSHAEEVAKEVPTAVVAASKNPVSAEKVQEFFMSPSFRVYTTDDVTGVELGGSLKNVLAIAGGICDGMNMGDNTKAALMTRGIAEMARLGNALGGRKETFAGLSGVGDLIVTCMSKHSRNRFVGDMLGKGFSLEEIREQMDGAVAEGVKTSVSAYQLAQKAGIETPLVNAVYDVLYLNRSPGEAVKELMGRSPKQENQ
ncbi:MAG: NAD(P)-dependent glycerol-3-phosphate dehydrogenase [Lentisphaerae bacterium]|nr:NAD(P)-dependent glycerol-3-phosphate dehydrogenase [Lentisphaerota bacterium]